jgi:glycosyltransferase involved in cell wall biosynthesis
LPAFRASLYTRSAVNNPELSARHDISIVIPLFNEEPNLEELKARLDDVVPPLASSYEILFVDDGSRDGSYGLLRELQARDPQHTRIVRFRRNFGKSAALAAGFDQSRHGIIVTMDADLQDLPEELPKLLARLDNGADLVSAWRVRRNDPISKTLPSKVYNLVTRMMTGVRLHDFNCGFKCYRRSVLDELQVYGERHRYIPVLASYRGFRIAEVPVEHQPRLRGKSKFGYERYFGGFFSLLTVVMLTRYTNKPLHFFGFIGVVTFMAGFAIDLYLTLLWLFLQKPLSDRPILMLGTMLIIIGVQFLFFGLLAEMIAFSSRRDRDYSVVEQIDVIEVEGAKAAQPTAFSVKV